MKAKLFTVLVNKIVVLRAGVIFWVFLFVCVCVCVCVCGLV